MPEYLLPGVYVEEVPFGAQPIEGVSTSTDSDLCAGHRDRPYFFDGKLLTASDLQGEQDYLRDAHRRHNRLLHGWGVVCGLLVTADPSPDQPWRVRIAPGMALAPNGDEACVPAPAYIDLAAHRPGPTQHVFIGVRYFEASVGADDAAPDATAGVSLERIRDAVSIGCLADLPDSYRVVATEPSLCDAIEQGIPVPCPPCAADCWVILGHVHLPASPRVPITSRSIDHQTVRRLAVSTARMQAQLVQCCCGSGRRNGSLWAETAALLRRWVRSRVPNGQI
jgi:hypothetical protein